MGPHDQRMDVEAAVGYRGALSKNYVDLQFGLIFPEKIPIYLLSWTLLASFMVIRTKKYEVPKWTLYIMNYHPQIHILIFNIVVFDFLFFATRALQHATIKLAFSVYMSFFIICLLSLDTMIIFSAIYDELAWLRVLKKRLQIEGRELELVKRNGELVLISLSEQNRDQAEREAWKRVKVEED